MWWELSACYCDLWIGGRRDVHIACIKHESNIMCITCGVCVVSRLSGNIVAQTKEDTQLYTKATAIK